jgi:hypothetical protein
MVLHVVLYGCETWSLTTREENRLRVFEERVLRRIFGRRRDEMAGDYIMRSYSLSNIVRVAKARRMRCMGMWLA